MGKSKPRVREKGKSKTCFVISPIDKEGSWIRKRSDQLFEVVIKPAVEKFGYNLVRADLIPEPGFITSQIIERLLESDLVVADLSFRNPNVYYELGIRHRSNKHVIQIVDSAESIPFDVHGMRTIKVDFRFTDDMEKCKNEIINQIKSIEEGKVAVASPVSFIKKLQNVENVPEEQDKINIQLVSEIQTLKSEVNALQTKHTSMPVISRDYFNFEPFEVPTPSTYSIADVSSIAKGIDVVDQISKASKEAQIGVIGIGGTSNASKSGRLARKQKKIATK